MLPNLKVGGTRGYQMNVQFPIVSANAGTAFETVSACASAIGAVYPEPVAGNVCLVTTSSSITALCYYDGTIWTKK